MNEYETNVAYFIELNLRPLVRSRFPLHALVLAARGCLREAISTALPVEGSACRSIDQKKKGGRTQESPRAAAFDLNRGFRAEW